MVSIDSLIVRLVEIEPWKNRR